MNSIKDALVRFSRIVRQVENDGKRRHRGPSRMQLKGHNLVPRNQLPNPLQPHSRNVNVTVTRHSDRNIDNVARYASLVQNSQKQKYRDFLRPLGIPNLKSLQSDTDTTSSYDAERARNNWLINKDDLRGFLYNREAFSQMVDLMRQLTPPEYVTIDKSPEHIRRIIEVDEMERLRSSFRDIGPKNSFNEIPSMPEPLTPDSFRRWIYQLTHVRYHYRNLSSLKSGIIADILLHTHNLDNEFYRRFRSADTYNYLIKWFGYDKNQNSFARELILVMNKDGHSLNLDTINQLLKICTTHLHIRQLSNTYHNITQNLRLAQKLGLGVDLTSFHRVYDSISSIYLRELYLSRLTAIGVPILRGLMVRIVKDFAHTTLTTSELIHFIENSLKLRSWKDDSHIYNQVIVHRATHEPLNDVLELIVAENRYDAYTVKYLMETAFKSDKCSVEDMWRIYRALALDRDDYLNVVIIFKFLVQKTVHDARYSQRQKMFLVRGIMHEMINGTQMPLEVKEHLPRGKKSYEYYNMFKRVVGRNYKGDSGSLTRLEACSNYYYGTNVMHRLFSQKEETNWHTFLNEGNISEDVVDENGEVVVAREGTVHEQYIGRYERGQMHKLEHNRVRDRLHRLEDAGGDSLKEELAARGVSMV